MGFFVSHIFIYMRLTPILIKEGRKEDLRKKYSNKFKEYPDTLDFILGISDLADTNFKYADFVLRELHPNTSDEEIEDAIELVKDFDRFKQSLEVKDINQYDLDGLKSIIDNHKTTSKSQLKKIDTSGAKKIFEDKNLLIVKPLTYEASCKYGAGTRWCTTMAGQSSYFDSHTKDNQGLYYVILKNFDQSNKFYKIAIHITPNQTNVDTNEKWYDATDTLMTDREKDVFNLGAPKVIGTIRKDYSDSLTEVSEHFFKKIFDFQNYEFVNVSSSFRGTENKIGIEFQKSEIVPDMPGHATMELNISVDEENIDQYLILITYNINDFIRFDIGYSGDNFEINPEFDFDIENISTNITIPISDLRYIPNSDRPIEIFRNICWRITTQIVYKMKNNVEFIKSIHGGKSTWVPNRTSYGFTFKKNAGMVKKLVDYLDSGKIGTKLDFLTDIGVLEKGILNGKPIYQRVGERRWGTPSAWRGQSSGFFNSARLAGILDYNKKGNNFILKKGPNFDSFKKGELKSL